jgi:hypothetical protein
MKFLHGMCALALAVALIGCGNKAAEQQAATAGSESRPAATETAPAAETAPATEATGAPVTLTGLVGCGHCNFQKTERCSAAIQVASGEVYVIDGVTTDSEIWKLREENAKNCEVVGTVAKGEEGLNHIKMTSYKIL